MILRFQALLYLTSAVGANVWLNSNKQNLGEIEVIGNKFFNKQTNEQFFIKGIAYQPSRSVEELAAAGDVFDVKYIDPLANSSICMRDLPYLVKLGVNCVRVYSIDPTANHDVCMSAFENHGIYVLADLSEPDVSIVREKPTWDVTIFQRYKDVVDSMQKYPNTLGFFAGNEVTNDITNTDASPFVKASIRDTKAHIKRKGYRNIPVGYSTNDDPMIRDQLADYFACDDTHADFYGVNMYEWCGYSSFVGSGYKERTQEYKDHPVPVFFSEFGCNLYRPRPFTEVEALFGPLMQDVWSGGLAFMYFEEPNQYGVVQIRDGKVVELEDFELLRREFSRAVPKGIKSLGFKEQFDLLKSTKMCPPLTQTWKASKQLPPTPDSKKCKCIKDSLSCTIVSLDSRSQHQVLSQFCQDFDCLDIIANGTTGSYGQLSDCDTPTKLSAIISQAYLISNTPGTCPGDGIATFNVAASGQCLQYLKKPQTSKPQLDSTTNSHTKLCPTLVSLLFALSTHIF